MRCYEPFSRVTREALAYACEALGLAVDRLGGAPADRLGFKPDRILKGLFEL